MGETRPFAALAHAFLPADPGIAGAVVEAVPGGATLPEDADAVVWGRLADGSRHALQHATAREFDLLVLRAAARGRLRVRAVHRLPAPGSSTGVRGWARGAMRAGIVVELASPRAGPRILDAVIREAGGPSRPGRIRAGAAGTLLLRVAVAGGAPAILRVTRAGSPGDPAAAAETLGRLARVGHVPRLLGRGTVAGASWSAEEALPGRRPAHVTWDLVREVAVVCACLPRRTTPPRTPVDDLLGAATRLPRHADGLRRLAEVLRWRLDAVPAIQRHGDLWAGNLLVDRRRLRGVVDWDAAHADGVPGADLVQLVGTEARRQAHRPLGRAVLERPWRSSAFAAATAHYWKALGIAPEEALVDLAGIAWWAGEIHHTMLRFPQRAADDRWVAENVAAALPTLTRVAEAPNGRSRGGARDSTPRAATPG